MRLSKHHEELTNGVGKCSVPMWGGGVPAGFCDEPAFGKQEPGQRRYGEWSTAWGKWFDGYCSGLACYNHGGPKCPGIDLGDGNFSGCSGKYGDCPTCGK
jgi:hypothetical protein